PALSVTVNAFRRGRVVQQPPDPSAGLAIRSSFLTLGDIRLILVALLAFIVLGNPLEPAWDLILEIRITLVAAVAGVLVLMVQARFARPKNLPIRQVAGPAAWPDAPPAPPALSEGILALRSATTTAPT